MSLPSFGVRKPVVANLVMFAVIVAGILFGVGLRREFFPEVRPNEVVIVAPYPGASPDEVERSLAIKIEDALIDLDDVKEILTTVREGLASVRIEFEPGTDIDVSLADVKRRIDALQDLPEASERITVDKFEPNLPAINLAIYGDAPEEVMKRAIRDMRDDLRSLPGMGDVVVGGVRRDEILVEARPEAMLEHGLSLIEISDRVRAAMIEVPAGSIRSPSLNVAVRTLGAEDRAEEVRNIVVRATPDGRVVKLGEVADVRDTFIDVDLFTRLNGKPAVSLTIFKVGDEDAVIMADMVKAYAAGRRGETLEPTWLERLRALLAGGWDDPASISPRWAAYALGLSRTTPPPGELVTTTDLSRFIVGRLELLSRNAFWGGVLVLLTLVLLLNIRVAFWVAAGLVISILGTLATMHFLGITLNLLTMFGLIIVLGILVDDAIVVAENITSRHEAGLPPERAAVEGTHEVMWPVVATVLTTVFAFLPLGLIEGRIGDLFEVLPLVVGCALLVSLLESLFILPPHMLGSLRGIDAAHAARTTGRRVSFLHRIETRFDDARDRYFHRFFVPSYVRALRWCLHRRYLTTAAAIALVIVSVGMVAGGRVPFVFISSSDAETLNISLRMPVGTPITATDEVVQRIEAAALAQPEVTAVFAQVGATSSLEGDSAAQQSHIAQLIVELSPVELRERPSQEIIVAMREAVGPLPGVKSLRIEEVSGGPEGPPITLTVTGRDADRVMPAVDALKHELAEFDGVFDVADDAEAGQRELRFTLRDSGADLGFTTELVARQIRGAVYGLEPHTFAGEEEDVDVRVTFPERYRRSLAAIEAMNVFAPTGQPVPLREIAAINEGIGYASINRLNRQRAITVTADVNRALANPEAVMASLEPFLRQLEIENPGVRILKRGRQEDVADSFRTLPIGMLVALGLIFVCLAWLFGSYTQPLIVLTAVPFSVIGVVWGHLLMGFEMTVLSLIGFVALSGVVVNDSLIFMEFFNEKRREGLGHFDAAVETGRARIRAILLTTITTVLGLMPLVLETSFQAVFLIPMGITISFGLMSATALVLVVLPCLLLIGKDTGDALRWLWHGGPSDTEAEAEDAHAPMPPRVSPH